MKNNKDIKPFYIYADKNSLYIKNINEQTKKLANNIHTYCANIDDNQSIHICALDIKGKLSHFINVNGVWKRKIICKIFNNLKNIKDMRLYVIKDILNIFVVENYSISDNLYKVSHFNFSPLNYKVSKYSINNIYKEDGHIYKLNIDETSNIIFEYNSFNPSTRGILNELIVFDTNFNKWILENNISRGTSFESPDNDLFELPNNIKDDIFEYCYSIKYKL